VRDRDYQSGAGTADVDTYQALTVCIRAPNLCKPGSRIRAAVVRAPAAALRGLAGAIHRLR